MEYRVLGRLEVVRDGRDVAPRGGLQRRLLSALVLRRDAAASADELVEVLWPGSLPANHQAALQTHMFRLRRLLPDGAIASEPSAYRLSVETGAVDAQRFEAAVYEAAALRATDPLAAVGVLDRALATWRGRPFEELDDLDEARIEAARLGELHLRACEERFDCLLALDRHDEVIADLDALAARHPLRERPQAQLMRALQRSGRSADALAVFERYRRGLAEELGIEPSVPMRDLHHEIVVGPPTAPAPPPIPPATPASPASVPVPPEAARGTTGGPLAGPRGPRHGLVPRYASSLVGREALVTEVAFLLEGRRLVTLIGTGGVGKTRVASEVCARLEAAGGPVWFCELAPADPSSVMLTVAAALGIEERSGTDLVERIAEVLRSQGGLLVLDNCEHVLDAAAELAEAVLYDAPGCRILATSRERLSVEGEHLCAVAPLPRPDSAAADQPAVRLFVDRARSVRPAWQPDARELAVVADVCRRLDGLPLALELAAARMHTATLAEVADGLERRFRVLTGGRRTTARHRSLSAAVTWSYDLLDEAERAMFDAVSLFQAPFRASGAAALHECDEPEAVDLLHALVERSLVHRVGERYAMLETLRQFGAERLEERGRTPAVRALHARYQVWFAEETARLLRVPGQVTVLDEVDASLSDLRMAKRYLAEHGAVGDLLDLALALRDYGFFRMRPEVLGWAGEAAVLAEGQVGHDPRVADAYAIGSLEGWKRGDIARSAELSERASVVMAAGSQQRYDVLAELGNNALISGRLAEAASWHDAALATAVDREDPLWRVEAHGNRILARAYAGDPAVGPDVEALLADLRTGVPELAAAWGWYAVGEAVVHTDPPLAAERLRRAMDLAERCGASFVVGVAGASFVSIEARHGDPSAAVQHYRWLLPHWQRAGVRSLQWTTLRAVAELLARLRCERPATVLLGAVTATRSGHEVFGDDARRHAAVERAARERLGDAAVEAALAAGRELDDDGAVAVALAAFDALS